MISKRRPSSSSYRNLISFIPESDNEPSSNRHKTVTTLCHDNESDSRGHEARSFYESLLNEDASDNNIPQTCTLLPQTKEVKNSSKRKSKRLNSKLDGTLGSVINKNSHTSSVTAGFISNSNGSSDILSRSGHFNLNQRQHYKLLQYAQLGELKKLRELFNDKKNDLDINFTDFYGWTPLMCAAKEGHVSAVKLFLKYKADKYLRNMSGDTALSLARNAGHLAVVSILENCNDQVVMDGKEKDSSSQDSSSDLFHCDICKMDFSQREKESHATSTVHLFNSGKRSNTPSFFLPNSNRGFQMLLRSGWNVQSGLGPDGKGRKYPVKTVLKQDRAGLGGEDVKRKKAKVTHFDREDVQAVKNDKIANRHISVRKAARNAARFKDKKDRRWEQNIRFELG